MFHRLLKHRSFDTSTAMSKRQSPAAERNKEPIWQVLSTKVIPNAATSGEDVLRVLEIGAGAGVHVAHFGSLLRESGRVFQWFPTDMEESYRQSIEVYIDEAGLVQPQQLVLPPISLTLNEDGIVEDETKKALADGSFDVVVSINMIHISPWQATQGLMKEAKQKLKSGGMLFTYGPYKVGGTCVESNRYGGVVYASLWVNLTYSFEQKL